LIILRNGFYVCVCVFCAKIFGIGERTCDAPSGNIPFQDERSRN
jgi:hypothetical protein